jgi:hypothetical protein
MVDKPRVIHFDVGKAIRRAAREHIKPAGTRVIPDKRNKPPKHKKPLRDSDE